MANEKQKMPPMRAGFSFMWFWGFVLLLIVGYTLFGEREQRPIDGDWNLVSELVEKGYVERINVLDKEKATVFLTEEAQKALADDDRFKNLPTTGAHIRFNTGGDVQYFAEQIEKAEAEAVAQGVVAKPVIVKYDRTERGWVDYFVEFLPWLLIIVVWIFFMRSMMHGAGGGGGGNIMNVGKARAQVFDNDKKKRVTFKDVAGLEEAKIEIMEIVDFLKKSDKYKALGAKIPKGALLVGPPGTGKTLLAKAVAGEANVPFLSMSGSDFVEMFVGVGASRVRDLFDQAKKMAPCIVFIDEIDAIGRARGKNSGFSGNDERENTLNQLLTEMDGFQTNAGVIVLAATNRVDILDKALMRAGRFDRQIEVGLPDVKERKEIFDVHLKNLKLDDKLDREFLAKQTPGFAGADIANVCNEAALIAARNNKDSVTQEDFLSAIDRIVGGLERRNMPMSPEERRSTAIHEAGHAVVMWRLKNCDSVLKVTIIPRGRSLGATWYLPEERANHNVEHFMHKMAGMLGGRIAEQQLMGITSTGALNDLERTSQMAYA
ncbi:MAG: ATP-dependent zinc metalloprotease FtsH, partial [Alistipes sp.]|nr:ATP-dependent zinc metalloprotease FtsH [Alistipes sp.]